MSGPDDKPGMHSGQRSFQIINRLLGLAQQGMGTGKKIDPSALLGGQAHGAIGPFNRPVPLTQFGKHAGSMIECTGVIGPARDCIFNTGKGSPACIEGFGVAAKVLVTLNCQCQREEITLRQGRSLFAKTNGILRPAHLGTGAAQKKVRFAGLWIEAQGFDMRGQSFVILAKSAKDTPACGMGFCKVFVERQGFLRGFQSGVAGAHHLLQRNLRYGDERPGSRIIGICFHRSLRQPQGQSRVGYGVAIPVMTRHQEQLIGLRACRAPLLDGRSFFGKESYPELLDNCVGDFVLNGKYVRKIAVITICPDLFPAQAIDKLGTYIPA